MSRVQRDRYHQALWHHASPSPASPLIFSFSAYSFHGHFCSQANSWVELMSSSLTYRTKKSWHTLTLICPDPPFNSQSVCSPFVFHLSRVDGQVLMLDIPSKHSMCSFQLVWSVCIQQKGVSYLCLSHEVTGTEMTRQDGALTPIEGIDEWGKRRAKCGLLFIPLLSWWRPFFGCFNYELKLS